MRRGEGRKRLPGDGGGVTRPNRTPVTDECPAQAAHSDVFAFPRASPETWGVALESLFAGVFGWLARRLAGVALAALAAAAIYGAWLFVRQEALQEWERRGRLQSAITDRGKIERAREALAARTNELWLV